MVASEGSGIVPRRQPRGTSDWARERKVGVPEIMGEYIDRQVNLEMVDDTYPRRGKTQALYEAARARRGHR